MPMGPMGIILIAAKLWGVQGIYVRRGCGAFGPRKVELFDIDTATRWGDESDRSPQGGPRNLTGAACAA
jgi:hypothetical protein